MVKEEDLRAVEVAEVGEEDLRVAEVAEVAEGVEVVADLLSTQVLFLLRPQILHQLQCLYTVQTSKPAQ